MSHRDVYVSNLEAGTCKCSVLLDQMRFHRDTSCTRTRTLLTYTTGRKLTSIEKNYYRTFGQLNVFSCRGHKHCTSKRIRRLYFHKIMELEISYTSTPSLDSFSIFETENQTLCMRRLSFLQTQTVHRHVL